MRAPTEEFRRLDLAVHAILNDVPLRDVHAVELHGGGAGRTLSDVHTVVPDSELMRANPLVRFLFGVRAAIGRLLGWDAAPHAHPESSYLARLDDGLKRRSLVVPGSPLGLFRALYLLPHESLSEIRNATVHAFLATALVENGDGYRLYWAVYVKPVSGWTKLYMAAIEPFRRFIIYPSIMRRIGREWAAHQW
jgi:uncharacterized protein DUF2867